MKREVKTGAKSPKLKKLTLDEKAGRVVDAAILSTMDDLGRSPTELVMIRLRYEQEKRDEKRRRKAGKSSVGLAAAVEVDKLLAQPDSRDVADDKIPVFMYDIDLRPQNFVDPLVLNGATAVLKRRIAGNASLAAQADATTTEIEAASRANKTLASALDILEADTAHVEGLLTELQSLEQLRSSAGTKQYDGRIEYIKQQLFDEESMFASL
jgi:hypothetical protein